MENLNNAVKYIVENELLKAKEIIHASLYEKMGKILEDKLMEFAPTVFSEKKEEEEEEGDEDTSSDNDDDEEEDEEEDEEDDKEDMKEGFSDFASHLTDVVAYLEKESGTTLSEEQISEVAHMILNEKLDEVGEEDEDVDNDGDEDESDDYLKNRRKKIGKSIKDEDEDEDEDEDKLDEDVQTKERAEETKGMSRAAGKKVQDTERKADSAVEAARNIMNRTAKGDAGHRKALKKTLGAENKARNKYDSIRSLIGKEKRSKDMFGKGGKKI
jgi:hypothetical protein